jgi:hypothetical protein
LGFVALKEKRFEEAEQFFRAGIQSAEEFGRVDELAKGQLGLASVHLETGIDLHAALALVNESIESFQQQGMQYQIQKGLALRNDILKAQSQTPAPQL